MPAEETGEVAWWDDPERIARHQEQDLRPRTRKKALEQTEFWGESQAAPAAPKKIEPRKVGAPAARKVEAPAASRVEPISDRPRQPAVKVVADETISRKGTGMSTFKIAKFLHVNGSLNGGSDQGRWLSLPGRESGRCRYQLIKEEIASEDSPRERRTGPRSYSSVSGKNANTYASW
ncbi:MAG: hypothetical protein V1873_01855 [Verrucomicrobiota bacterium]